MNTLIALSAPVLIVAAIAWFLTGEVRHDARRAWRAKWPLHRIVWELFKAELSCRPTGWDDPSA